MKSAISIVFAGDFFPPKEVIDGSLKRSRPPDLLGPAVEIFQDSDLAIANLEYPLTTAQKGIAKYGAHLKGDASAAVLLRQSGIDLVTLANNHTYDYGQQGVEDTMTACAQAELATVGAGRTPDEAKLPYSTTIRGRKISIISVCENEFSVARHGQGGAHGLDLISNFESIKSARESADIVIVLLHGGSERSHFPSPQRVRICRFFAEVGASAVVCHHPHYVQGYEVHKGVPILYSLGTLFSTSRRESDYREIPVARITFFSEPTVQPVVHFDFFNLSLDHPRLEEFTGDDLKGVKGRFSHYCQVLQSEARMVSEWEKFCHTKRITYLSYLVNLPTIYFRILRRLRMGCLIAGYARWKRSELMLLGNIMRCESHREIVLHLLEKERRP